MTHQLNKHVNLHIIPNEKYKTVRILIRFATNLTPQKSSQRSLLASLMETNSKNYPSQIELSKQLSDLYGAGFGIGVSRKGNEHYLTVGLNLINDRFAPSGLPVLESAVSFLKEIIFQPNISDNHFEEKTFSREQANLIEYIESIFDDKQTYSALQLQQLFFNHSPEQQTPSFGDIKFIQNETPHSLADYYHSMINNDHVDILVIGNVDDGYVKKCFTDFGFTDRTDSDNDLNLLYKQPFINVIQQQTEVLPVVQSKLNLAYHSDIYYFDNLYFPLLVFNGLFGGFPHSKLFMNVREKHSLAYYASSSIDTFRGFITVQTGIDADNRKQVLRLINEQLKELATGTVTEEELEQTKSLLSNQYLLSLDSQHALLEQAYLGLSIPKANLSQKEWLAQLNRVTVKDIQKVAKKIKLQAVYFMEGSEK
ncbi:EF-P 5-aminopentanol modification-associated protein YfmF [Vagococcus vulneris]|uniref:EF-P 5-aminopentanol modification-associated protein YfmF n=1 Tax=Vagococcus vulneris TaxID=1977869 RepID=UPI001401FD46